jgi:hypothetical protein
VAAVLTPLLAHAVARNSLDDHYLLYPVFAARIGQYPIIIPVRRASKNRTHIDSDNP